MSSRRKANELHLEAWIKAASLPYEPPKKTTPSSHVYALTPVNTSASSASSTVPVNTPPIAPNPLEFWTNPKNLPHKVATILSLSQKKSGFNPVDPNTTADQFVAYSKALQTFPGAYLYKYDGQQSQYDSTDIKLSISNIVSLFEGLATDQLNQITDSIQQMGEKVFSQTNAKDFLVKFSQQVLDNSGEYPYVFVYIYYTSFMAQKSTTTSGPKTNTSASQTLTIQRLILQFNDSFLISYAGQLNQLTATSLQQWIDDNTTKDEKQSRAAAPAPCFSSQNVPVKPTSKLVPIIHDDD